MENYECAINDKHFGDPMPWIGVYVTVASLVCSLAMAGDIINGLRLQKLWFPCRFFSLNATSLTLLAIATKLPVDLTTPMPGAQDQFTKLSGTVLICTAMANFMPSLGTMEHSQVILNVVPLVILVITIFINVCIQLRTEVIFTFSTLHMIILFFMLIMLLILCSSALTVSTTSQLLKQQYELKHQQASDGPDVKVETSTVTKLKNDVRKYWVMAHSCSPQYVLSRSLIGTISGAFCFVGASLLMVSFITFLHYPLTYSCHRLVYRSTSPPPSPSDYKWSTKLVSFSQVIAVAVGTVAPACRWFAAVNSRAFQIKTWSDFKGEFKVESYWIQILVEWKDSPLYFDIKSRSCLRFVYGFRNLILDVCLQMQTAIVLFSKSVRLAFMLVMTGLKILLSCFLSILPRRQFKSSGSVSNEETWSSSNTERGLNDFVLHLEGEEKLVHLIMKQGCIDTEKWIRKGRKNQLKHLMDLLSKSTISEGFKGVCDFDSDVVRPVGSEESPPNCWALPLVTLVSIAIAIPCTDRELIKPLLHGVNEGLRCVRFIEKKLDLKGLVNIKEAADIVWQGVDLNLKWLDVDLATIVPEEKDPKKIIERLADIGKDCVLDFEKTMAPMYGNKKNTLKWTAKALAGNSLYRICQTILDDYENKFETAEELLKWLSVTISDILGACLTNLPHAISIECSSSAIEAKEDSIRKAASFLGEAENILETLGHHGVQDLGIDQCAYIDDWRASKLKKNTSRLPSATSNDDMSSATPGELRLSIE
ncbi:uncharacterized protein LOC131233714 [Magnolia sinica]|uniref:uncharacterized protein LOC131233714 n=1 Tax=Magnolia sinica TaxID=86752 RepID=UPI00265A03D6|nr:uncharacterized protein LOC131233714 [Magnolia sinica]